jgi:hypothetical protein
LPPRGQRGGGRFPTTKFHPIYFVVVNSNHMQISKRYDNPFWEKSNPSREKRKKKHL